MVDPHKNEPVLSRQLERLIQNLPDDTLSTSELIQRCGEQGLLLLSALLTLVFLIPISLPGVSTVFGAVIVLVGISRLRGRPLWLPKRVQQQHVATRRLRPALQRGLVWVRRIEKISRAHRLSAMAKGRVVDVVNNLAFILAALLLMSPFGFVPLSNTLPGIALLFYALGLAQRDGMAVLIGHAVTIMTLIYFAVLIGGGGLAIKHLLT